MGRRLRAGPAGSSRLDGDPGPPPENAARLTPATGARPLVRARSCHWRGQDQGTLPLEEAGPLASLGGGHGAIHASPRRAPDQAGSGAPDTRSLAWALPALQVGRLWTWASGRRMPRPAPVRNGAGVQPGAGEVGVPDRAGWASRASWSAPWLRGRGRHVFSRRSVYRSPLLLSSPGKTRAVAGPASPERSRPPQPGPARPGGPAAEGGAGHIFVLPRGPPACGWRHGRSGCGGRTEDADLSCADIASAVSTAPTARCHATPVLQRERRRLGAGFASASRKNTRSARPSRRRWFHRPSRRGSVLGWPPRHRQRPRSTPASCPTLPPVEAPSCWQRSRRAVPSSRWLSASSSATK